MTGAGAWVAVGTSAALALGFALLATRRCSAAVAICAVQAAVVAAAAFGRGEGLVALVEIAEAVALAWWAVAADQIPLPLREGGGPAAEIQMTAMSALPLPLRDGGGGRGGHSPHVAGLDAEAGGDGPLPPPPSGNGRGSMSSLPAASPAPFPYPSPYPSAASSATHGIAPLLLLLAALLLALLAATIPGTGLAIAVTLVGLLGLAGDNRPARQALALLPVQGGAVLAALTVGLGAWQLAVVVLPLLPALGFAGLWLGNRPGRTIRLVHPIASRLDLGLCGLALLLACTLPWQLGHHGGLWRLDARAAHVILLLCALAAAAAWARRTTPGVWGARSAVLAGTALATIAVAPLMAWLGMAIATIGAIAVALPRRAAAWRALRLGATGLAVALAGAVAVATPQPHLAVIAMTMLGYGAVAMLAPELTIAAAALVLRLPAPPSLLLGLGLAALLAAALCLATETGRRHLPSLAGLAQGGVAVAAFGLGSGEGALAGVMQLTLLALTQCALLLSPPDGFERLVALAGLAAVPPFGLFSSLAQVLAATAAAAPWVLLPLGAGVAGIAWAVLPRLPPIRPPPIRPPPIRPPPIRPPRVSPAWLPLALLLVCGFAMPAPWLAWIRLAAR